MPPEPLPTTPQGPAPVLPSLLPDELPAEPFTLFAAWFDEARRRRVQPNPNAMVLATVGTGGRPSARVVLCKALEPEAGSVLFFTNYASRKGTELASAPEAALCFHWDALDRQVRLEGPVTPASPAESDAYFASRPWLSRASAWASHQSQPVGSRQELADALARTLRRFGIDPDLPPPPHADVEIPRPPHWGGYRLWARAVELWAGAPAGRLHDRGAWARELRAAGPGGFSGGAWSVTRLQP